MELHLIKKVLKLISHDFSCQILTAKVDPALLRVKNIYNDRRPIT